MANPFNVKFDSTCVSCDETVPEGDEMFAHEGQFICGECAESEDVICDCGSYKKSGLDECFSCMNKKSDDADDMLLVKKASKPQFNKERALSWSAISSFKWNKEEWYEKYVLGKKQPETIEMKFGKEFAKLIEDGKCPLPLLPIQSKVEHKFEVMFGKIKLLGYVDSFCHLTKKKLEEYKTGKKAWDQKRADNHGQVDMYLLMNYITNKVKPEDVEVRIHWIPTQDNGDFSISFVKPVVIHSFKTKRTMADILKFGSRINNAYKEMEEYAKKHE